MTFEEFVDVFNDWGIGIRKWKQPTNVLIKKPDQNSSEVSIELREGIDWGWGRDGRMWVRKLSYETIRSYLTRGKAPNRWNRALIQRKITWLRNTNSRQARVLMGCYQEVPRDSTVKGMTVTNEPIIRDPTPVTRRDRRNRPLRVRRQTGR